MKKTLEVKATDRYLFKKKKTKCEIALKKRKEKVVKEQERGKKKKEMSREAGQRQRGCQEANARYQRKNRKGQRPERREGGPMREWRGRRRKKESKNDSNWGQLSGQNRNEMKDTLGHQQSSIKGDNKGHKEKGKKTFWTPVIKEPPYGKSLQRGGPRRKGGMATSSTTMGPSRGASTKTLNSRDSSKGRRGSKIRRREKTP